MVECLLPTRLLAEVKKPPGLYVISAKPTRYRVVVLTSFLLPAVHMPAGIYPLTFAQHEDFGDAA
jgi:hypothetical protein